MYSDASCSSRLSSDRHSAVRARSPGESGCGVDDPFPGSVPDRPRTAPAGRPQGSPRSPDAHGVSGVVGNRGDLGGQLGVAIVNAARYAAGTRVPPCGACRTAGLVDLDRRPPAAKSGCSSGHQLLNLIVYPHSCLREGLGVGAVVVPAEQQVTPGQGHRDVGRRAAAVARSRASSVRLSSRWTISVIRHVSLLQVGGSVGRGVGGQCHAISHR